MSLFACRCSVYGHGALTFFSAIVDIVGFAFSVEGERSAVVAFRCDASAFFARYRYAVVDFCGRAFGAAAAAILHIARHGVCAIEFFAVKTPMGVGGIIAFSVARFVDAYFFAVGNVVARLAVFPAIFGRIRFAYVSVNVMRIFAGSRDAFVVFADFFGAVCNVIAANMSALAAIVIICLQIRAIGFFVCLVA